MMRHAALVRASLALTAAAFTACSDQAPTTAPATEEPNLITNGTPTGTSYGNVGSVLIDLGGDGVAEMYCTGTLISETVFLTAAHCLDFPATTKYYVTFAPSLLTGPYILATEVHIHPDYASAFVDIGVVILPEGTTTGITPAELPTLGYLDEVFARGGQAHTPAVLVGYGTTSLGRGNTEPVFQGIRMVAQTRILQVLGGFLFVATNAVNAGRGGSCFGDSGGPLFLASDVTTVVGVASITTNGACISQGGYVRLDTEAALSFITQFLE
jgi:hypothetical protein